jgi:hypothetical protein
MPESTDNGAPQSFGGAFFRGEGELPVLPPAGTGEENPTPPGNNIETS